MPVDHVHIKPDKFRLAQRVRHFIVQKPGDAFLLVRMAAWVALLSFLIKFLPLPRVLALIANTQRANRPRHPHMTQERLAQLIDSLLGMNVLCFTPTCWKRAPVLHRYLALHGIQTRIIFGVRKEKEEGNLLAGHAWLEADGRPLLEASPPLYTRTYSFPA